MDLLEKVAASSLSNLSSFLNFIIVSETIVFSFSYLDLRFVRATSAVFLFDFRTVLSVAICSRLVDNKLLRRITCSCNSAISASLLSSLLANKNIIINVQNDKCKKNTYIRKALRLYYSLFLIILLCFLWQFSNA